MGLLGRHPLAAPGHLLLVMARRRQAAAVGLLLRCRLRAPLRPIVLARRPAALAAHPLLLIGCPAAAAAAVAAVMGRICSAPVSSAGSRPSWALLPTPAAAAAAPAPAPRSLAAAPIADGSWGCRRPCWWSGGRCGGSVWTRRHSHTDVCGYEGVGGRAACALGGRRDWDWRGGGVGGAGEWGGGWPFRSCRRRRGAGAARLM
mmetsp:Transcript_30544/g.88806  ORF Transcript_30544/g.88806 Transcript_30544/m.88806 type:complete len:203 (+) Transcript_30544:888-1496(+)